MSHYPGNHTVRIQTGTVDIVPSGEPGRDLPVIARLPVRLGEAATVKRRAYLMAAAPGLAATLESLLDHLAGDPNLAYSQPYLDAKAALRASRVPETRS